MIRRQNHLTTATPTVYDFIDSSYMLLRNVQKKWQQTPSAMDTAVGVNVILVSIMKINVSRCILLSNLNRLCCSGFVFISIRTGQKYTLEVKLLRLGSNPIVPTLTKILKSYRSNSSHFLSGFIHLIQNKEIANYYIDHLSVCFRCDYKPFAEPQSLRYYIFIGNHFQCFSNAADKAAFEMVITNIRVFIVFDIFDFLYIQSITLG